MHTIFFIFAENIRLNHSNEHTATHLSRAGTTEVLGCHHRHHPGQRIPGREQLLHATQALGGNRLQELNTNPKVVESLAREKYRMKRPNEDVFVIVDAIEEEETEQVEEINVLTEENQRVESTESTREDELSDEPADSSQAEEQPAAAPDSTPAKPVKP